MWFDGLSSRWMGDVAAARPGAAPLKFAAKCNFVGFFGEGDEKGIGFTVSDASGRLGAFSSSPGPGRLFIFRQRSLDGWWKGAQDHSFAIEPAASGKGELRLESVLTATILPADPEAAAQALLPKEDRMEALDHGRGKK